MANAATEQTAQDTWEQDESQSAHTDQLAVATAADLAAQSAADATQAGNDNIAAGKYTRDETAATAAPTRDRVLATNLLELPSSVRRGHFNGLNTSPLSSLG